MVDQIDVDAQEPDGLDLEETREWLEAFDDLIEHQGHSEAIQILDLLASRITESGGRTPFAKPTPYRNTIPRENQQPYPGDLDIERRIRNMMRWNALAMVLRANQKDGDLGGHISTFASSALLYDVGFNHFFRGWDGDIAGDLIYYQGHSAPGIYARSYLERRMDASQLDNFRQETGGDGLSSYPHPKLMPEYWEFPTVSMGLGPIQAIYQAHIMKYLDARGLVSMGNRKVWAFLGDGECDEPETLGTISLASREHLDNLIFVVNCNLQRLDGPVRGNGKIIQELEGEFQGAGWNVIKVVWGSLWDELLENDDQGLLQRRMDEAVDGEYQNFKAKGGGYTREKFFGAFPELKKMVENHTDSAIMRLNRGGHDPVKVYNAYWSAINHKGSPTVILAKTVKGYGMGDAGESENKTHQVKKLTIDDLKRFINRFELPIDDRTVSRVPYYQPPIDSEEMLYMQESRKKLGGYIPRRVGPKAKFSVPGLEIFQRILQGTGERENSTTSIFVQLLRTLTHSPEIKDRIVPIIPDEARTFGMEGMFRELGIYSSEGQLYEPEDAGGLSAYRESKDGQVLEEGINEAGAFAAWLAAATSYSTHHFTLIPFYIFYSMFGFQRVGDLAWAAGDMQARGFLLGATAGRTTLNGEGLQHQDGHSHVLSAAIPNCISYDPCFAYELAVIIHEGLTRMFTKDERVFYYITLMNERYPHPEIPPNSRVEILQGMYRFRIFGDADRTSGRVVNLLGSGTIFHQVLAAAECLADDHDVTVHTWSVTSFTELAREGADVQRWNMLHPDEPQRNSFVSSKLSGSQPVVAATDYLKLHAESIRGYFNAPYSVLGTDGFGRSDTRNKLRRHFEVDSDYIAVAALKALADSQIIPDTEVKGAIERLRIEPGKPNPRNA